MPDARSRRRVLAGCGTAIAAALAGCAARAVDAEEEITEEFDRDVSTLVVEATNGDVAVEATDRETVLVTGTKQAASERALEDVELVSSHDGDVLELSVETDDGLLSLLDGSALMHLALAVPSDLNAVTVETANGDVSGEGLAGDVGAETTNGDVVLAFEEVTGDVDAGTTNGDVELAVPDSVDAALALETTNGEVALEIDDSTDAAVGTEISTEVGDGSHTIDVETANGDVTVRES